MRKGEGLQYEIRNGPQLINPFQGRSRNSRRTFQRKSNAAWHVVVPTLLACLLLLCRANGSIHAVYVPS